MSERRVAVGLLALQGDFAAHGLALRAAAAEAGLGLDLREVRRGDALVGLDGLVMPGGESTTMLKLLALQGLDTAIPDFVERGGAVLGTCAGCILLAREVRNPSQASLGLLDVAVARNAYGRQVDSFVDDARVAREHVPELGEGLEAVFIRAPRIERVGPGIDVLATHEGDPVLVRGGRILAATFHPELARAGSAAVHRHFLERVVAPASQDRVAATTSA